MKINICVSYLRGTCYFASQFLSSHFGYFAWRRAKFGKWQKIAVNPYPEFCISTGTSQRSAF